jgi:hypothetical protein
MFKVTPRVKLPNYTMRKHYIVLETGTDESRRPTMLVPDDDNIIRIVENEQFEYVPGSAGSTDTKKATPKGGKKD